MNPVDQIFRFERWLSHPHRLRRLGRLRGKVSLTTREIVGAAVLCLLLLLSFNAAFAGLRSFSHRVPEVGGVYREAVVGSEAVPNPLFDSGNLTDQDIVALVFSGMARRDAQGRIVPDLASGWTISPDQTTYTVTLRPHLRFQDGAVLTSADIAFTIRLVQSSDYQGALAADWKNVTVTTPDARHVVLKLPAPYAFFAQNLTLPILPEHLLREIPASSLRYAAFNSDPVGSGPYSYGSLSVIEDRQSSGGKLEEITLNRNPYYYGVKPYISQIVLKAYDNAHDAYDSYIRRETDAVAELDPADVGSASHWPNLKLYRGRLPEYVALFFNTARSGPLQDATVRSAIAAAVNRRAIIHSDLRGAAYPVRLAVLPGYPGYDPRIATPAYSPTAAKASLQADGWSVAKGGIREKAGQKLQLSLVTGQDAAYRAVARTLQQQLKPLGIALTVRTVTTNQFNQSVIGKHDYDALLFGENVGASGDLYSFWDSTQISGSGTNFAQYSNDRVDKSLEEARTATDSATVAGEYHRLEQQIAQDTPAVFLYTPTYIFASDSRIHGVSLPRLSVPADRWSNFAARYIDYRLAY